jgi:regulator of protease activity HflC (stomatin/prohibitin superfamily)
LTESSNNHAGLKQLRESLRNCYKIYKFVFILALLFFLFSGIHTVEQGKVAYIQRLGKWIEEAELPGKIHFAFPFFIDQIVSFDTNTTHTKIIDSFETPSYQDSSIASSKVLLTKDESLLHCRWSIAVNLNEPLKKYSFSKNDSVAKDLETISHIFNSICVSHTANMSIEDILSSSNNYKEILFNALNSKLKNIHCGYIVTRIDLINISFPDEVKYAFEEVQKQLTQNVADITNAKIFEKRLMRELSASIEKQIDHAHTQAAILSAKTKADAKNMQTILDNYSPPMRKTLLRYKLQTVFSRALKSSKDQTFVLQEGSELRIKLAEDAAIDKIKRQKVKLQYSGGLQ